MVNLAPSLLANAWAFYWHLLPMNLFTCGMWDLNLRCFWAFFVVPVPTCLKCVAGIYSCKTSNVLSLSCFQLRICRIELENHHFRFNSCFTQHPNFLGIRVIQSGLVQFIQTKPCCIFFWFSISKLKKLNQLFIVKILRWHVTADIQLNWQWWQAKLMLILWNV